MSVYGSKRMSSSQSKPDSAQQGVEGGQKSVGGLLLYRAELHAGIFFPFPRKPPVNDDSLTGDHHGY